MKITDLINIKPSHARKFAMERGGKEGEQKKSKNEGRKEQVVVWDSKGGGARGIIHGFASAAMKYGLLLDHYSHGHQVSANHVVLAELEEAILEVDDTKWCIPTSTGSGSEVKVIELLSALRSWCAEQLQDKPRNTITIHGDTVNLEVDTGRVVYQFEFPLSAFEK